MVCFPSYVYCSLTYKREVLDQVDVAGLEVELGVELEQVVLLELVCFEHGQDVKHKYELPAHKVEVPVPNRHLQSRVQLWKLVVDLAHKVHRARVVPLEYQNHFFEPVVQVNKVPELDSQVPLQVSWNVLAVHYREFLQNEVGSEKTLEVFSGRLN